jgi:hypothetical protein
MAQETIKRADQIEVTDTILVGPNKMEEDVYRVEHDGDTAVITTSAGQNHPWVVHASHKFRVRA